MPAKRIEREREGRLREQGFWYNAVYASVYIYVRQSVWYIRVYVYMYMLGRMQRSIYESPLPIDISPHLRPRILNLLHLLPNRIELHDEAHDRFGSQPAVRIRV